MPPSETKFKKYELLRCFVQLYQFRKILISPLSIMHFEYYGVGETTGQYFIEMEGGMKREKYRINLITTEKETLEYYLYFTKRCIPICHTKSLNRRSKVSWG
ncbi:MAG: hypothetical protein D3924_04370 [Candidatus Electrothrix sp. AR4]|nr:hypothetical protein [Candidatus Electrothrix sp. AR4]